MPVTHLFGPVPSRRLGRSLGVDPVPFKTCTFDCIYCQLGPTTLKTLERRVYVPAATIIDELRYWFEQGGEADFITLSGSGEPTLNSATGEIIAGARDVAPDVPVAVLTNGSLLWDPQVREEVSGAQVIMPSLDAARPDTFQTINRPAEGLELDRIIEGLCAARQELEAQMWLEIMLVRGINDSDDELQAFREALDYIQPDRVQLNTVVRPPAEASAQPLEPEQLIAVAKFLGHRAEVIAPLPEGFEEQLQTHHSEQEVLQLLRHRPCTLDDIAAGLGMHRNEAIKYVTALLERGHIKRLERDGRTFYVPA